MQSCFHPFLLSLFLSHYLSPSPSFPCSSHCLFLYILFWTLFIKFSTLYLSYFSSSPVTFSLLYLSFCLFIFLDPRKTFYGSRTRWANSWVEARRHGVLQCGVKPQGERRPTAEAASPEDTICKMVNQFLWVKSVSVNIYDGYRKSENKMNMDVGRARTM